VPTIKQFIKAIIWTILWATLGIVLIVTVPIMFFSIFIGDGCAYSESVAYVKSLPKERLENLFVSLQKLKAGANENTLAQFSDIGYKHVDLMSDVIVLGGCFDNKAIIRFNGLENSNGENQSIVLSYGEYPLKIETLWAR
jgi:hypothetical protein